jgi:hypothetical protein
MKITYRRRWKRAVKALTSIWLEPGTHLSLTARAKMPTHCSFCGHVEVTHHTSLRPSVFRTYDYMHLNLSWRGGAGNLPPLSEPREFADMSFSPITNSWENVSVIIGVWWDTDYPLYWPDTLVFRLTMSINVLKNGRPVGRGQDQLGSF